MIGYLQLFHNVAMFQASVRQKVVQQEGRKVENAAEAGRGQWSQLDNNVNLQVLLLHNEIPSNDISPALLPVRMGTFMLSVVLLCPTTHV